MVEHSFGVQIVRIHRILFESCLMNEKEERKKIKIEIFPFDFFYYEEKSWDAGAIFCIRIAKAFHV